MLFKINKIYKYITLFSLWCGAINVIADPNAKIISYDKHTVFFCPGVQDTSLSPIRQGPGILDYCNDLELNIKHYSSQDENLRKQCPSKSVYRIVSQIGPIDTNGVCNSSDIKWYCDSTDKVSDLTLPISTLYCPGKLPDDYVSNKILVCPHTVHSPNNLKLLSGGMALDSFYCDNVPKGVVHYLSEDQTIAKYSEAEIFSFNNSKTAGQLYSNCPSKSAYRILTYKGEPNADGKCQVVYDVYCDPQKKLQAPVDSGECPVWTKPVAKTPQTVDVWKDYIKDEIIEEEIEDEAVDNSTLSPSCLEQGTCGTSCGQIPYCNSCGNYYMMTCQPGMDCTGRTTTNTTSGSSSP